MARSTVAVLKTTPETVLEDYRNLLRLAGYRAALNPDRELAFHVNLAWQPFFPSVSSPPWQLDGVMGTVFEDGFPRERTFAWYDDAAGVTLSKGRVLNRHVSVLDRFRVPTITPGEKDRRVYITPKRPLRALQKVFPGGIPVPERLAGRNIVHLPTMRTDSRTVISGAVRSVYDGLLGREGRRVHDDIHGAMVDALAVQREISGGTFAVMDAVFAGEGPDARDLEPREANLILASSDPVALDSVALRIMGFDPLEVPFVRMAHESGLGVGDPSGIDISGIDISEISLGFHVEESKGAKRIRAFERRAQGTILESLSGLSSMVYYDWYRFLNFGEKRIREALRGPWGAAFERYRR